MATILSFVRKPAARPRPTPRRWPRCLQDFSIEVMPRTAARIADFRALLPAGHPGLRRPHRRHRRSPRCSATARRLVDEGFAVMPHFPARGIDEPRRARPPHRRLRRRRRAPGAGDRRRHRPAARALRRVDGAARDRPLRRRRLHRPARRRPPGGQPRHRPRRRRARTSMAALRWKDAFAGAHRRARWRSPPSSPSRPSRSSPGPTACAPPGSPCRSISASPARRSCRP